MYEEGEGVNLDYTEALKQYLKAKEKDYGEAIHQCGRYYYEGLGIPKNYRYAIAYFEMSGPHKDEYAAYGFLRIGHMYRDSQKGIVEKNLKEALYNYKQAVAYGEGEAARAIGDLYARGLGVKQSSAKSLEWYMKAANMNSTYCQFMIGSFYLNGHSGILVNLDCALHYFTKAAEGGLEEAKHGIAMVHEKISGGGITNETTNKKTYKKVHKKK